MRSIDYLVVHTAGAYDWKNRRVVHQPISVVRQYHVSHNGWRDIGYHRYIEEDGAIMHGRREEDAGAHVGGFNLTTLGICVSGHGDHEPFNESQIASLVMQLTRWCREHRLPASHCVGHREVANVGGPVVHKTCPGAMVDMDLIREKVAARLEACG